MQKYKFVSVNAFLFVVLVYDLHIHIHKYFLPSHKIKC